MKITKEVGLQDFDFWSGGKDTADVLTGEQFETMEQHLEEMYPEGMTDTQLNDFFWFEREHISQTLGYESFDAMQELADKEDTEG